MVFLDYLVLAGYFLLMAGIGVWSMRHVHVQEDYLLGGRSFGKLMQTFAAFGAGTGSSDPVNTGRTTFTSGMSGMWSVMYWLFVTPFYWITAVWYRRMRHLTLGDWFAERYESKALGASYAIFGIIFYMVYGSMLFSAIGKVAAPLMETDTVTIAGYSYGIEYVLVPIIGVVVLIYGILGGLQAAYYTDLIQGLCIILLSIILIPFGLNALVEKFGDPATQSISDGFGIMHQQLPEEYFDIVGGGGNSEFPLHRILAIVIINLFGVVVQPHFIATGGGSAKTENSARVGLVLGNFLKRFCTIGWVLTALIALALFADHPELASDPDRTWGVASRELLGPGLTGLMLACLLAALMSSVDAYMIVGSGLVTRNIYAPYFRQKGSEREYLNVARITGVVIVLGSVIVSLNYMDVFLQLQMTWIIPMLFAPLFWVGIYWRRATTTAAWCTIVLCGMFFFILPFALPRVIGSLRENPDYLVSNSLTKTTVIRAAAPADVAKRNTQIDGWRSASGTPRPDTIAVGYPIQETTTTGGQSIYWQGGVTPVDKYGHELPDVVPLPTGPTRDIDEQTTVTELAYPRDVRLRGQGNFKLDFLLFQWLRIDLTSLTNPTLDTLQLPVKIILPFTSMILFSLVSHPNNKASLDRYYAKMKTPVQPDPEEDRQALEESFANLDQIRSKKLFPNSNLEFQKPSMADLIGFVFSLSVCFAIIGLAAYVARIGAS